MQIFNFLLNLEALQSSIIVVFSSNAIILSHRACANSKESCHQSILDKIISIASLNKRSILIDK